jgi:glycosyltransferase involved in cell wall biosynthesis
MDHSSVFELPAKGLSVASPLLTIIVPTYNRASCLDLLLNTLAQELRGLEDKLRVVVGDNASTDNTPELTRSFLEVNPTAQVLRHGENLGAEENFCRCIDMVTTPYFWIVGDDDIPKNGVLSAVVALLEQDGTDLLYLSSEWMPAIRSASNGEHIGPLTVRTLSGEEFAREVNVWVTFISGMIVNRERLFALKPDLNIRRFTGTCLVQLGWVLPLLQEGATFKTIPQRCLLATSGNSGGYGLFAVFGTNFPAILEAVCGPSSGIARCINRQLGWVHIPRLIKGTRFGCVGAFLPEDIVGNLSGFKGSLAYHLAMWPMIRFPRPLALLVYAVLMAPLLAKRMRAKLTSTGGNYA